ncbi:hypothetical protein LY76DRAFT_103058 [Colletotrichum caudatum]|nr:hypothetical protein LY76DRAFT_103058 [Colletotrichum caudatum]
MTPPLPPNSLRTAAIPDCTVLQCVWLGWLCRTLSLYRGQINPDSSLGRTTPPKPDLDDSCSSHRRPWPRRASSFPAEATSIPLPGPSLNLRTNLRTYYCLRSCTCDSAPSSARPPWATGPADQPKPGLGCFNRHNTQAYSSNASLSPPSHPNGLCAFPTTETSYMLGFSGPNDLGAPWGGHQPLYCRHAAVAECKAL